MSYDSRLAQTGRKVANARRKYYGSFDYGSGIDARLRGGSFSFSRKHAWGGPNGNTWIPEIDETEVDEPEVQELIAKYFRKHPNDAWKFGKDPETGLDRGTGLDYGDGLGGMSSGGTNWGGLASLGIGMIGGGVQDFKSMKDKSRSLNQKYDIFGTDIFSGISDNTAFLDRMSNTPLLSGATAKDFRDKTVGQDILSALSTGVSATINSGGNYWVGLGAMALDAGKSVWERLSAKNKAKEATLEAKRKNRQFFKDMAIAGQDVDARNDWMRMYGYHNDPFEYALGGPLHSNGGDYNGGLTFINAGGRHEDNPYEGVPSGVDEEGNPNLVEEGEVIWNNEYVFSDRLKVPKELANKYKLGGKKDYTFAEAIEKLTKENTISPNDFITIATTKEIVNEFMDAQEAIRQEEQLAAREELEAAQAQDFLAQLDAAQGMAPSMGAPINMEQVGALPNEAPVTEGEMTPPGYAVGGEKRHRPGYEERREQGYSRLYEDELIELLNQYPLLNERRKAERAKADAQEKMEAYRSGEIGVTNNERVQGYINNLRRLRSAEKTLSEMPDDIMKLALGGNKFDGGGYKVVKVGNRYFITTEGAPKITGKMYGNRLVVDDQFKNLPSFDSAEKANREAERMRREALPALEYQSDIEASGITSYAGNKILKEQTGYNTKGQPTYTYTVVNPNNGEKYTYSNYEAAARKYSSIPRRVEGAKGGYMFVTPYGDTHWSAGDAKKALKVRLHPQSSNASSTKSSTNRGIGTTAMAAEMPANFNAQLDTALGVRDTLSVPALQQPSVASPAQQMQAAQTVTVPPSGSGTGTAKSTRRNANTGTRSATNVQTSTSRTLPEINSWDSLYSTLEGYTGSLGASAANGKYAIDRNSAYWNGRTAKEIESDEIHNQFSKWVKEHSSDPNVQKYFEYLDKGINKKSGAKTLLKYDKNGKPTGLADDWEATFNRRRGDGDLGIYHINPKSLDFLTKPSNVTVPDVALNDFDYNIPFDVDAYLNSDTTKAPKGEGSTDVTTPSSPRFNYRDTSLRYAPPIGAAMDWLYRRFNRPDYSNADRIIEAAYRMGAPINIPVETIGDYRRRNPFDERYLVNMANQNRAAAARGIANTAGGNRSMDLLGNMSLAHSNQQELGEIMRQAYLANRQDDAQVAEFNRGTNVYNMNAINQRNLSQAQLNTHRQQAGLSGLTQGYGLRQSIYDNWDDAAMESYNSLLASLGAIGKENEEYNLLQSMAEEGYFDHAYMDNGRIRFVPRTVTAKGGKLNRKKRRF